MVAPKKVKNSLLQYFALPLGNVKCPNFDKAIKINVLKATAANAENKDFLN